MSVGSKLRYVRGLRGLTLNDLHDITGLSISYISDIENEKSQTSLKSLTKIAGALRVDPAFLLEERSATLDQLARLNNYELPEKIKEYVSKSDSLPYVILAKKAHDQGISLDTLSKLIDLYTSEIKKSE